MQGSVPRAADGHNRLREGTVGLEVALLAGQVDAWAPLLRRLTR